MKIDISSIGEDRPIEIESSLIDIYRAALGSSNKIVPKTALRMLPISEDKYLIGDEHGWEMHKFGVKVRDMLPAEVATIEGPLAKNIIHF